ncbi:MAG: ABC transporter ATP-binding protein/permease [Gammaproteobacteria bacterium]|nr:ABC transporter ATP-binding protein/permease [Gammaproteobacteria bacterium]
MRLFDYFESLVDPFPAVEPTTPPKKLLPFLWHYSKDMLPWLILSSIVVGILSLLEVGLFKFLGSLVDWLGSANPETFLAEEGNTLILMGVVVLILIPAFYFLHSMLLHQTIYGNFPMAVRWRMHRLMLGQSYAFYQDEFAGRIATKVMQTALAVRESVMKVTDVFVYVAVYFMGAMVLVGSFGLLLVVPFIIWLIGYVVLLRHFLPILRAISKRQADARSEMAGRVVDSYTNIMTVKLFAHAGREAAYARESMSQFLDTVHPQMRRVTELNSLLSVINGLLLFLVGGAGIYLWMMGQTTVGGLAIAIGLVLRLQGMSQWIMWELSALFENVGVAYDGMAMLTKERHVVDRLDASDLKVSDGSIQFKSVTFHYGKDSGAIDDLTLNIRGGEKIGLVGRSGAGKTTMTNLLLRLYDVEKGMISIDGQDISNVDQDSLRQNLGVVTQDTSLLHRSVFDNIAYGKPGATMEDVIAAAQRANAHEFIQTLEDPKGGLAYSAQVGERGVKLSGGQRQRVAIARMFLKDAPILLLDEATSALDSDVEAAIQENLAALMAGKTVIAIAHRLSTIAAMDRLIVLDNGNIIEQGSHDTLVQNGGLYADLWARQSGGFLTSEEPAL